MFTSQLLQQTVVILRNKFKADLIHAASTLARVRPNLTKLNLSNSVRYTQTNSLHCWKCGVERRNTTDLFCQRCNIIQQPHNVQNYFTVFGVDTTFDVDAKALQQKYRQMQSLLHPDKFTNSTDTEKKISEEYSSLLNKAYNTLQVPLKRAQHLLLLNDERIEEDEKAMDKGFLVEMMELNEEVDEVVTPEQLKHLSVKNKNMMNKITEEISSHFKHKEINRAKEAVMKMKYFNSISKRINEMLREKGIVD